MHAGHRAGGRGLCGWGSQRLLHPPHLRLAHLCTSSSCSAEGPCGATSLQSPCHYWFLERPCGGHYCNFLFRFPHIYKCASLQSVCLNMMRRIHYIAAYPYFCVKLMNEWQINLNPAYITSSLFICSARNCKRDLGAWRIFFRSTKFWQFCDQTDHIVDW